MAVVGAGLTGLVAAHALEQRGVRVLVIDAGDRPGGAVGTLREQGYLVETGANSALDNTPLFARLLDELRIADQRVATSPAASRRFVVQRGKTVELPLSPPALLRSGLFSARAKLRLLREPFIARAAAGHEESIAAFVRRRLGEEILDYAIEPFVAGVYAGDPERLSIAAAFPRLHALEQAHGSLVRGQLASARQRKRQGAPMHAAGSFSFRSGMQTLPDALAGGLSSYRARTRVLAVERDRQRGFTLQTISDGVASVRQAAVVVLATPAYATAPLVATIAPAAAQPLAAIGYAPVAVVATAYRREDVAHTLDGFGMLVPRRERRQILGTLFSSALFADRAPHGEALLTTFVGGMRAPALVDRDDEVLEAIVARELAELLDARSPRWSRIVRWRRAIPQYELGHRERVDAVLRIVANVPGLYVGGSWRDGVAVGDRVTSGYAIADEVFEFLAKLGDGLTAAPA